MPPLAQPAAPTTTGEATLLKFRWDSGATSTRILAKPTFVKAPNHGAAGDVRKVPRVDGFAGVSFGDSSPRTVRSGEILAKD